MATLTMPTLPGIRSSRFGLRSNTLTFHSTPANMLQTSVRRGARWFASYELPAMKRAESETWLAFLTSLNGRVGRFYAGDPAALVPRGIATGSPLVRGASQTGSAIITDAWTAGVTGILLAGDYIAWATPTGWRELHKVTANANSDGAGIATFAITPPIRESPADNTPIIKASATCVMRLLTDEEASWDVDSVLIYGIKFNAEEVFPRGAF